MAVYVTSTWLSPLTEMPIKGRTRKKLTQYTIPKRIFQRSAQGIPSRPYSPLRKILN